MKPSPREWIKKAEWDYQAGLALASSAEHPSESLISEIRFEQVKFPDTANGRR